MDPTYFLKDFEISGKDEYDNSLEISEETNCMPDGNWVIDLTHYDNSYISYNNENYIKVFFHNEESRMYMFLNEDDYRIYGLTIRQVG